MTSRARHVRGLTLVELMLALSITAMVAAAVAAMLGAVTSGVETRRDNRHHLIHSHSAQVRLSAYIAPSRACLYADNTDLVLWFDDSNESDTVHASELRWIEYVAGTGELRVSMVQFPENWSDVQRRMTDREYSNTDWWAVRDFYRSNGMLLTLTLVDQLDGVELDIDQPEADVLDARHITYRLTAVDADATTLVSGTLRKHRPPSF